MGDTQPPSLRLPQLRGLAELSPALIIDCIEYLRKIYTPEVRGSRIRRRIPQNASNSQQSYRNASSDLSPSDQPEDKMAVLRADKFERAYAIRWLTYLAHNGDRLQGLATEIAEIIDRAASLLANCGGPSSAGILTRLLTVPSARGPPISVKLRDIPLDDGMASVGAQTWGGACVLAEIISIQPADFGLEAVDADTRPGRRTTLRVLELGAGTGLVGIAVGKIAMQLARETTVVCTDAYPPALENLAANIAANFPAADDCAVSVSSHLLDWSALARAPLEDVIPPPLDAPFDLILGADIVYEAEHAVWIRACLVRLLTRTASACFHLVIPLRRTHARESSTIETVFASDGDSEVGILYKETIVCDVEGEAGNEVEYAYYRIGWT
ncbi:putative methyltransferase-domain-containing protein [Mycena pura]|uniref:Methyltransferase-domain-containing protein n=1 Tax=Mycena pura TaxID=153505 RepID=A0AAD6UZ77_9AGAR|nr:putative methyltransferase-domain-containing protein [Mycena pura]